MEFQFLKRMFEDKEIMNPLNPEEVFTCSDLVNDWKICRREWRLQTVKKQGRSIAKTCWDYRSVAHKCFWKDEDDFIDYLIEQQEQKKNFYNFLEKEGSVLADKYRAKDGVYTFRNTNAQEN